MTPTERESSHGTIEPGAWPERRGRGRVLIEHPDAAELWAHGEILREAGFDVAGCTGPTVGRVDAGFQHRAFVLEGTERAESGERLMCPLAHGERCPLVDGADVVVASVGLVDSREILAVHTAEGRARMVVEGARGNLQRDRDVIGDATVIEEPVTERRLLEAVEQALASAETPEA